MEGTGARKLTDRSAMVYRTEHFSHTKMQLIEKERKKVEVA